MIYEDPASEMRVYGDRLKEQEKQVELLKMECRRWQNETNELNLRCQSYEAQIEQRSGEFRQQVMSKDVGA
jgi:hypothetical protein